MWWCCGKRTKDAPGCKFSKHENKDDFEDANQNKEENEKMLKFMRCSCCKELGHVIEKCPRDPNFRTLASGDLEQKRINQISEFRKLHADTVVNTTHFIKKSVMIPLGQDEDGTCYEQPSNT